MKASLFEYGLPTELIAQKPFSPRDKCRLMILERKTGKICDRVFDELPGLLKKGDVLVFNDSKVIPARIKFRHEGKEMEIFLIKKLDKGGWITIGKPGKRLKEGAIFDINGLATAKIVKVTEDGQRVVKFSPSGRKFDILLPKIGSTPLPPYIKEKEASFDDYQTIYARRKGSVAAPTAGLHFTKGLLDKLAERGIEIRFVTLHVGPGTFLPLKTNDVKKHKMHGEFFEMSSKTAKALNKARKENRRIVAVGTTSVRVLEASCGSGGGFKTGFGETSLYIYPGYRWKCVDALITNFHLPRSTLLLLTCSFGGRKLVLKAYERAIRKKYRFYSFGDAMMIQ